MCPNSVVAGSVRLSTAKGVCINFARKTNNTVSGSIVDKNVTINKGVPRPQACRWHLIANSELRAHCLMKGLFASGAAPVSMIAHDLSLGRPVTSLPVGSFGKVDWGACIDSRIRWLMRMQQFPFSKRPSSHEHPT